MSHLIGPADEALLRVMARLDTPHPDVPRSMHLGRVSLDLNATDGRLVHAELTDGVWFLEDGDTGDVLGVVTV